MGLKFFYFYFLTDQILWPLSVFSGSVLLLFFNPKKIMCIDFLLKIFMVLRERGALWALTFSLDDFMVLREGEREVGENVV